LLSLESMEGMEEIPSKFYIWKQTLIDYSMGVIFLS
jgi:hypothetical protein